MAKIIFSNTNTAAEYEALTEYDQEVEVPVLKVNCNCKNYKGMISDITPCAAKRYLEFGGNLIAKKETVLIENTSTSAEEEE